MSKSPAKEFVSQLYWEFHDELAEAAHLEEYQTFRTSIPQAAATLAMATALLEIELYAPPSPSKKRSEKPKNG